MLNLLSYGKLQGKPADRLYGKAAFRSLRLTYRKPDGGLRHWEAIERTNCDDIVAIVPITGNNDLIPSGSSGRLWTTM